MNLKEMIATSPEWQQPLLEAWASINPEDVKGKRSDGDDSEYRTMVALQTWPVFLRFPGYYINTGPLFDWCSDNLNEDEWLPISGGVWCFKNEADAMKVKLIFSGTTKENKW